MIITTIISSITLSAITLFFVTKPRLVELLFDKKKRKNILSFSGAFLATVIIALMPISATFLAMSITTGFDASKRGWETDVKTPLTTLMRGNKTNHVIEKNYKPKLGDIVIYVRYGCPDCEALYAELESFVNETQDIYMVGTRSKTGLDLRETYPVSSVPSAVLIGKPAEEFNITIETETGITLDREMLNWLVEERQYLTDNQLSNNSP